MSSEYERLRKILDSKFTTNADTNICRGTATEPAMQAIDKFINEEIETNPCREIKIGDVVALRWDIDEDSKTHEICGLHESDMKREKDTVVGKVIDIMDDTEKRAVLIRHQDVYGEEWYYHPYDLYIVDE